MANTGLKKPRAPRFLDAAAMGLLAKRLRISPREVEIIQHLFSEGKEAAIARSLKMSPHTLRTHVERLYRKLRVSNRTELIVCLYETLLELITDTDSDIEPICSRRSHGKCPLQN